MNTSLWAREKTSVFYGPDFRGGTTGLVQNSKYSVLFYSIRPEEGADHFRTIEEILPNQNSNLDSVPVLSL